MKTTLLRVIIATPLSLLVAASSWAQSAQTTAAVTTRSVKAVGYQVGAGRTTVDLKPTGLVQGARGDARVEAQASVTTIQAKIQGLNALPQSQLGSEFLAYVVWAVSPEGRAVNLGEVRPDKKGRAELQATTQFQSFSLFVTAEPYAAVRQPSEMLILENDTRKGTKGRLFLVENYQLMRRSQYQRLSNPLALTPDLKVAPIEIYQARNAVEIARSRGADKYAPEIFAKAKGGLDMAEAALARKAKQREIVSLARQTAQFSEDARALTAERMEAERVATEKAAAAAKATAEAEAKAAAEATEARRRADEEARRQAELASAREAQLKAEAAARQAQLKAEAAARQAQLKAEAAAKEAEALHARKAAEQLRAQLLEQFNRILETRDTERGLVITMADVLFDTGRYELRQTTREALARVSGILLAHPGLTLSVEGHTDSTGSDDVNQTLSERRAATVRNYLVQQGLSAGSITATGFGKTKPVADNATAAGRQKNRRVELIVSGEVIGQQIGS